ncbi:unnamed protein product [Owenia fusiformis]|uniref:BEN domain-containing protein n=1 Tax=Owenia fusiformis TaxID=6347 RepID=A0A8S4PUT9_OWEFU|nr:unnamed protein product [Owenia fusiformis]
MVYHGSRSDLSNKLDHFDVRSHNKTASSCPEQRSQDADLEKAKKTPRPKERSDGPFQVDLGTAQELRKGQENPRLKQRSDGPSEVDLGTAQELSPEQRSQDADLKKAKKTPRPKERSDGPFQVDLGTAQELSPEQRSQDADLEEANETPCPKQRADAPSQADIGGAQELNPEQRSQDADLEKAKKSPHPKQRLDGPSQANLESAQQLSSRQLPMAIDMIDESSSLEEADEPEEDMKVLRRQVRSLRKRVRHLESLHEDPATSLAIVIKHMPVGNVAECARMLCLKVFSKDELITMSTSGKKGPKTVVGEQRPPLDQRKLYEIVDTLKSHCLVTSKVAKEKIQNFQKVLRAKAKVQ